MAHLLFLVLSFCIRASFQSQVFITPESAQSGINCTLNEASLIPCYLLNQIVTNEVLSSLNTTTLELIFLPGTHVIPENITFYSAYFKTVTLQPLNSNYEVVLSCQSGSKLIFSWIGDVNIHSLHFLFCALLCYNLNIVQITDSVFEGSDEYAVNIIDQRSLSGKVVITNSSFISNYRAIIARNDQRILPFWRYKPHQSQLSMLIHNSIFQSNRQVTVDIRAVKLTVNSSNFANNSAIHGGGIRARESSLTLFNTTFIKNKAYYGGGSILLNDSSLTANGCHFRTNIAYIGGAIYAELVNPLTVRIYNSFFQSNKATKGGALFLKGGLHTQTKHFYIQHSLFQRNLAGFGGAINIERTSCSIRSTTFLANVLINGYGRGGALHCSDYSTVDIIRVRSLSNSALNGSGGFAYLSLNCLLSIQFSEIRKNAAIIGGGIFSSQSRILFRSTTVLAENRAVKDGGALALFASTVNVDFNTTLVFNKNVAASKGGAIFFNDSCDSLPNNFQCFIATKDGFMTSNLTFSNNSAKQGTAIYGGLLDRCMIAGRPGIEYISQFVETSLAITSNPIRVCLCNNSNKPDCEIRDPIFDVVRGDYIELTGAVVDQNVNLQSSSIVAEYSENGILERGERRQNTAIDCVKLSYHVFTSSLSETLILRPKDYCKSSEFSKVSVHFRVLRCSRGFEWNNDSCICERRIIDFTTSCSIRAGSIQREGFLWLSYNEGYLKVNKYCPLNFCNFADQSISLRLPDKQCTNHRSGVLCGGCQANHSIVLGSSKCIECTSKYAFTWLIPVFALAGVALVGFLLLLNVNISHGTLNGLVFYANVMSISGLTSFQNCTIHPILTVFIAWINLDFGIETCFYSGLDTYQKTWLQFTFPFYIWLLVGAIILASHYSSTAMKLFGRCNIAILATLFLLSYTKIFKTIVMALTFTEVLRGAADNVSDQLVPYEVWLYDGNIEYLKGVHVPLFAVALLLLIFLVLPYTVLLTFGQFIRSIPTKRKCILWCIRSTTFISIMDAYHAPYTKRHRYWTGLLLLSRCALIFALVSSYKGSNLLAVTHVTALILIAIFTLKMSCTLNLYKNFRIGLLETSFHVNLLILLYYLKGSDKSDSNACKYITASISFSIVTFFGILSYHSYLQMCKTALRKVVKNITIIRKPENNIPIGHSAPTVPTTTNLELRESLLDSNKDA